MANIPLCALVQDGAVMPPETVAAATRGCLSDIRLVLRNHGFHRTANALMLAVMALDEDCADVQAAETARLLEAG